MRAIETAIRARFQKWWSQYQATCARLDEAMTETAIRNRFQTWRGQYQAWRARFHYQQRQIFYEIFDRVFRAGEQLVVLSVVVIAWEKTHLLILTVFSCVLLAALAFSNIFWAVHYFEREWSKWLVGIVVFIFFMWILLFGQGVLDSLMLALAQG